MSILAQQRELKPLYKQYIIMKATSIAYFLSLSIQTQFYLASAYTEISRLLECIYNNNENQREIMSAIDGIFMHDQFEPPAKCQPLQQPPKKFFLSWPVTVTCQA